MDVWNKNKKQLTSQGQKARDFEKETYNEVFDESGHYIGYPVYQFNVDWEKLGNPPAWCESTAEYVQSTGLCDACSKYDFRELLEEPEGKKDSVPSYSIALGTIGEILSREDCSFCQFLMAVALHLYGSTGVPSDAMCKLERGGDWQELAIFSVNCTGISSPDDTVFDSKKRELTIWRDYPWPLGKTPSHADGGRTGEFKLLHMVSFLVKGCIELHPKCRQQESLGIKMATTLFVIDVRALKIVRAPGNCKYAALSYVWGYNAAYEYGTTLTESSEEVDLEFRDGFPLTILHALNVTKQLGFPYLWVDQLCIPEDTRPQQIAEMDKVYRKATLTLVAAVEDSGSGLPGIGSMNRKRLAPPILRVNDLNIGVKMPPSVIRALGPTVWSDRGWTYQEKVLSSRLLYFTEEDIYYLCLEGEKSEQDCHAENLVSFTRNTFVQLGGVLATAHGRVPFQIFGDCVCEYTRRKLTYPSDILNAFAGITSYLSSRFDWSFCWGLPDDNFAFALLWTSVSATRREARDSHNRLFPSWTWAGWMGAASYYSINAKSMRYPENYFPDFVPVGWDPGMLEEAAGSGVLALNAECVEITKGNCDNFLVPGSDDQFTPSDRTAGWAGCSFAAIALVAGDEPLVRGLVVTNPASRNGRDVVERLDTAAVTPDIWLALSRAKTTLNVA